MSIVSENPDVAVAVIKALILRLGLQGETVQISEGEANAPFSLASRVSPEDSSLFELKLIPDTAQ